MVLHGTELGQGPPVCLLHGLFGRAQNFGTLARALAPRHRVLSLDLRNHGASPHVDGMSYAAMADDVLETLQALQALPARVLGHSMGGKVAMTLALTAPSAVIGLAVADIAPVAYAHHNAGVARAMLDLALPPGLLRRAADAALANAVPDPIIRAFLLQNLAFTPAPAWRIGLREIADGITDIEGWPNLARPARYDGPALFVAGGRSDYVLPSHWPAITALFPAARLVRLAGAGHWLHADAPDAFTACVGEFFEQGDVAAVP